MNDKVAPRRDAAPTTPDPIEIAMEAEASGALPAGVAHRVLVRQEQLIGWQVASERAGFALKVLTGLAGLAAAATLGAMIWQARQADGLIIKPFSVPPEMAQKGVTGEALASQMLDQLGRMAAVARSGEPQRQVAADWGSNVSIEIPQTGVSLSQVDQWLRDKLGRQTRVTGELMAMSDGRLMLVSRVGSLALPAQAGTADEVPALVVRAAEALYGGQQPLSYWNFLTRTGQDAEAEAVSRGMTRSPDRAVRALGYSTLGNVLLDTQGEAAALAAYARARTIDPTASPSATSNTGDIEFRRGHLEAGAALWRQSVHLIGRSPGRTELWRAAQRLSSEVRTARIVGDHATVLKAELASAQTGGVGYGGGVRDIEMHIASDRAALHDILTARAEISAFEPATKSEATKRLSAQLDTALSAEDWAAAVSAAQAVRAAKRDAPDRGVFRAQSDDILAQALTGGGWLAEAEAVISPTPLDCQPCVMARGQLAEARGNRALADHWFGEGVRMAPSWAAPHEEYGRVLLARRDAGGALRQAQAALRIGPRFADAMELAGEAMLATGDAKAAAASFAAAAELTPKWGRLHLKWGEALANLNKSPEARRQLGLAAALYLTPDERAELARMQGKR